MMKVKDRESSYLKNIMTLSVGTIIAQLVVILFSPIITRLYNPEIFGLQSFLITIVTLITPIISLRYEITIVMSKDKNEVRRLLQGSVLIQVLFTILITLIITSLLFFTNLIPANISYWIYSIIPLIFLTGFINVLNSYNNYQKKYRMIAKTSIIRSLSQSFLQVLFGILSGSVISLIAGQILGLLFGIRMQLNGIMSELKYYLEYSKGEIFKVLKEYKNQPLYSVPSILLNGLAYSFLNLYIGMNFGLIALGFYALSFKLLGMPIQVISLNISRIFMKRAAEDLKSRGNFRGIFIKTFLLLSLFSIPIFLLIAILAPKVFGTIFGAEWSGTGSYISILSLMFGIRFIVSPLSISTTVLNKQSKDFLFQICFLIFFLISIVMVEVFQLDVLDFLKLVSGLYSLNFIFLLIYCFNISGNKKEGKKL